MTQVVVVGAGITGLVAARELALAGADVTLVDPAPPGGKLRTTPFDTGALDEGADAFLARVPEGIELCRDLGIDGDLVSPAARRAYVWSHGALRPLPEAHVLGVPADLDDLAATGIVSTDGIERARHDLTTPLVAPDGDVTIGAVLRERLGDEVTDRLIDPLVGGINAGDTDHLSLAATTPQIDAALRSGAPSLIEACRAQRAAAVDPESPVFFAPRGGMGALADAVQHDAEQRGIVLVSDRVAAIEQSGSGWQLALANGPRLDADGIVITTPAGSAADLLRPHAGRAATLLAAIPYASVTLVSLAVDAADVDRELDGSGYLVPRVEGRTITACSWASSKWAHLADRDTVWLRASVGRDGDEAALSLDDDALIAAVLRDLSDTMALRGKPREVRVSRWPSSFPQYRPGHLDRVAAAEADLTAAAPTIAVAGAALRGLGVPACIRQARAAAKQVVATLDSTA